MEEKRQQPRRSAVSVEEEAALSPLRISSCLLPNFPSKEEGWDRVGPAPPRRREGPGDCEFHKAGNRGGGGPRFGISFPWPSCTLIYFIFNEATVC